MFGTALYQRSHCMRKCLYIFFLLIAMPVLVVGQQYQPKPKAEDYFKKAKEAVKEKKADKALAYYQKAVAIDPGYYEAQAQYAILLNRLGRKQEAIPALEHLLRIDPGREPYIHFQLGKLYLEQGQLENAANQLEQFSSYQDLDEQDLQVARHMARTCRFRIESLTHPVEFNPVSFTDAINSSGDEFNPTFTADGQTVVFTRNVGRQEDFYSSWMKNEVWQEARALQDLNTPDNEGAHCLSKDGKTMYFTACQRSDGLGSCDLYMTRMDGGHWSDPVNLGGQVNSRHWDSQPTLSADGRLLIFSSKRPNGQGGADLWYTTRSVGGAWREAKSLPGSINSHGDEETPFLHADGKTLYFSSNGHPGMGMQDLFVSRLIGDSLWSEPENLGYPINTSEQEQAMTVGLDGETAYFSSNRRPNGQTADYDLFTFIIPEERQGRPVTYVSGQVRSSSGTGLPARIRFQPLDESAWLTDTVDADSDGTYLICLPAGNRYGMIIEHPGYSFFSQQIQLNDDLAFHPYRIDAVLFPLVSRDTQDRVPIVLKNILFDSGSASLLSSSSFELERVRQLLMQHPDLSVRIDGHTDDIGDPSSNMKLSEDRARAVVNWLVKAGIDKNRLTARGWGETRPLVPNDSAENRQLNRRTELVLLP